MLKDSVYRYGIISQLLHWLSALLTLGSFGLGIWMVELGYYDDWYHQAPALHISFGLLLFALSLLRLLWRTTQTSPPPLASTTHWQIRLALGTKLLLYGLVFVLLISGYFITTADGASADFFSWLSVPASIQLDGDDVDTMGLIHEWGAWWLIALIALHACAALLHHFIYRDNTLRRMLPFLKH